jgi:hypothetical protein
MIDRISGEASLRRVVWLCAGVALLAACGGGGGDYGSAPAPAPAPTPAPPPASAPGGLYVGYYAESPTNNPEDPTLGVLHLALPANDAAFSGAMFFTYVGCQTSNLGAISGNRSGNSLSGNWNGTIDGSAQSGSYSGAYSATTGLFSGSYTVTGGKQFRDLSPCIQYFIAANGTWELLGVGTSVPASFGLTTTGTTAQWTNPSGTAMTLVAVLDEAQALAGQTGASRFQAVSANQQSLNLATVPNLTAGTRYVIAVATANAQGQRLSAGSTVLTR